MKKDLKYTLDYWKHINKEITTKSSSFSKFCSAYLNKGDKLLDICCGNGRDSIFFIGKGLNVHAFDINSIEQKFNFKEFDLLSKEHNFSLEETFNHIYCRFVLHAIPEDLEDYILINSNKLLLKDGLLFIEVRSDKGKVPDNTHYRRLISKDKLKQKLINLNFEILYEVESTGLSMYNKEDPVLIRFVAKKTGEIKIKSDVNFSEYYDKKNVLDPNNAKHLLLTTHQILYNNDIPFLLVFGTLLGAYRDKNFIPYDTDIDIALFAEHFELILKLIDEGYFAIYGIEFLRNLPLFLSLKYKKDYIDLWFYVQKDGMYRCGKWTIEMEQINQGVSEIEFLGISFKTVNNIERYLERHYRDAWRKPIQGKHARF